MVLAGLVSSEAFPFWELDPSVIFPQSALSTFKSLYKGTWHMRRRPVSRALSYLPLLP